jgi:hypothetical protein
VVINSVDDLQVTSLVAEADAGKVAIGQSATVTFSATNQTASGTVTAMDAQSTVSNNVVEYGVTVSLSNPLAATKLGQTASISITTDTRTGVLTAPSSAITTVGAVSTVTVQRSGVDTTARVQIGLVGTTTTEILSGVAEGDVLVIPNSSSSPGGFTFPAGLGRAVGGLGG